MNPPDIAAIADPTRPDPRVLVEVHRLARAKAKSLGASDSDADDVAQGTVLQLLLAWDRLNLSELSAKSTWPGYVRRSARNRYLQNIREQSRRNSREEVVSEVLSPSVARPGTHRPLEFSELVEDDLDSLIGRLDVITATTALTAKQRQVVLHVLEDGLSVREIAALYETQPATVESVLGRATNALRVLFD